MCECKGMRQNGIIMSCIQILYEFIKICELFHIFSQKYYLKKKQIRINKKFPRSISRLLPDRT